MNPVWHFLNGIPQIGPLSIAPSVIISSAPILGPGGTAGAVTFGFTADSDSDTGMYHIATNGIGWATNGTARIGLVDNHLKLASDVDFGWSSTTDPNGTVDAVFSRAAADVITTPDRLVSTGPLAGIGYAAGAGGTQTQGTSKATTVVLNTITGEITMHNATLNAATIVSFTLTNSAIALGDHVVVQHVSAGTVGAYGCTAVAAAGSATVYVRNNTAGNLGEAIVLKYSVIKSATS